MFVDFHVHPNLPKSNVDDWLDRWWVNIRRSRLDALVITEHSYKNPERAYTAMVDSRPGSSGTLVFPGVEALTSEGIDVLAFSESDKIYDYEELVTPYALSFDELVDFLGKHGDIVGIIPHPFTPGTTGIISHLGEKRSKKIIDKLGRVEVHNGAMRGVLKVFGETGLSFFMQNKFSRAQKTFDLPKAFYPKKPRLLSAGSDAHSPDCLGAGVRINQAWKSRKDAFRMISSARGTIIKQKLCHPYRDTFTAFSEWWMKKWL